VRNQQGTLVKASALLVLLGIFTGFLIAASATNQISANTDMMVSAHLNALLGAFWLLGVGWSLPWCTLSQKQVKLMISSLILCNYSNWLWTAIKAFFQVHAIEFNDSPANNIIFMALSISVVLPALIGSILWVVGAFKKPSDS
jgi:hydroxylaminobenzene mutase